MDSVTSGLKATNIAKEEGKSKLERKINFMYTLKPGDEDLLRPVVYHSSYSGKELRTKFIHAVNYWLELPQDKLSTILQITDNLHNVTLLVDDIQDASSLRRGVPCAYTIFGIANVANACTFHDFGNYELLFQLNHPMALKKYLEAHFIMLRGQGMELYMRDKEICPTVYEYEQVALGKTGGNIFLPNHLMQLFAKKPIDLERLLTAMTLYAQIDDDNLNLTDQTYFDYKGFCEDITEGKFGYPTMHAVHSNPKIGEEIIKILKLRTTDVETKKRCLSLIESCGSFKHTRDRLDVLEAIIWKEIEKFKVNPHFNELIALFMRKRRQ